MEPKQSNLRTRDALLLSVFAAIILMQRVHLYDAPLFGDICAYAVIGHEMLHGRQLYSDLWERKPPLLYATYSAAECVVGYGRGEIFLLGVGAAITTLLLIYFAARAGARSRVAGLFAAGFWVLLNCDLDLTANQPDPETFINLCLVAGFWLLMRWTDQRRFSTAILLGAVLSSATYYKHNTALACLALLAGQVLIPGSGCILRRMLDALIAGGTMILAWSILFGYFFATGRSHIFIDVLFHQNFSYSRDPAGNLTRAIDLHHVFPPFMVWMIPPIVLCILLALCNVGRRGTSSRQMRPWLLLIAWAIGISATIAVTGYLYPHYYQLWLPVGSIAGGWAAAALLQKPRPFPP